jgi:tryptophanyl-tRNA synthetase
MGDTSRYKRLVTGDPPAGKLHLGHLVGSLENRLRLQSEYECFFIIAFVTKAKHPEDIRRSVIDVATDWLPVGIDPNRSAMFIQSEVPVIDELMFYFAMLLSFNRVMRNPTLKDELRDKGLGDSYPFGFLLYAVGRLRISLRFVRSWCPLGRINFLIWKWAERWPESSTSSTAVFRPKLPIHSIGRRAVFSPYSSLSSVGLSA